ncbi:MAG: ABC transporter permease [Phycisphaerales bacterium]|nr:ABC transporter permease [Phycisphaerales bacterium]
MWAYVLRRLLYSIPIYLGIILFVMAALRVNDPVYAYLGKHASREQIDQKRKTMGLDQPFLVQYGKFLGQVFTLDFESTKSWQYETKSVGEILGERIGPTAAITVPALVVTTVVSIGVGLIAAFYRGRLIDRALMVLIVLGMSVSVLVFIIFGQYFGANWLKEKHGIEWFASGGYEPWISWGGTEGFRVKPGIWVYYCALPVLIDVILAMGYDTRFYRAVMVEETGRDYITTAVAKGATRRKVMFAHMLKNAMIPIITRVMISFPFLIGGSILLERYFRIPGMGNALIDSITNKDFPVIQAFTAVFAAVFVLSVILTDVLYALVDPRVRLS